MLITKGYYEGKLWRMYSENIEESHCMFIVTVRWFRYVLIIRSQM